MKKELIVVKFGGTSVATRDSRSLVISHIEELIGSGKDVVVVVSAMGKAGSPYATDTFLEMVREDSRPEIIDLLASCGETIAACVLSDELEAAGHRAAPLTGAYAGIKTDGRFGKASFLDMDTSYVESLIEQGMIPVITGYQGIGPDGKVTTMGRGSSDISAVEAAARLGASQVLIYSDVPGICKADPDEMPEAPVIEAIDYDDIVELARWGFKVVHPEAVMAAKRAGITIRVKSTFVQSSGTKICQVPGRSGGFLGAALLRSRSLTEKENMRSLGNGLFVHKKGELSVITVLNRPKEPIPAFILPNEARQLENGGLVHIMVPDGLAAETLKKVCRYFSEPAMAEEF